MEQTADQENVKNRTDELSSKINVDDMNTLNKSTRPQKKTKEEKRKEKEEKETQRQELRKQMKEEILMEIRKTVDEKRRANEDKNSSRQNQHVQKNENITLETINKLDDKKLRIYDNTRLNRLTRILNVGMKHIVSFLEEHPELGVAPKLSPNGKLNKKQVIATIEYFKDESNRDLISIKHNSNSKKEKTERHDTSTIHINPDKLQFKQGYVKFNFKNSVFVLKEGQFNKELNKIKTDQTIFENGTVELSLNNKTESFNFVNSALHEKLKQLGIEMRAKKIEERKEKREKEKEQQKVNKTIIIHTNLVGFKFYNGIAYYTYNNEQYAFRDFKFVKDYNKLFTIAKTNEECRVALKRKLIKITLNLSDKTFVCNPDFNIHNYLDLCMRKFSIGTADLKYSQNKENYDNSDYTQRIYCTIENIEFFDGYYKIWIVKNGIKINNIRPLIIKDINSLACLQIVSKYFITRLPSDIIIIYTNNQVLRLVNEIKLQRYVETLKKEKDVPTDWWNRSDNREVKTLDNYRKIPTSFVNKEVSYKNIYIDYLISSYQGENPLLIAYEIFNGQEEKCFVFNISIDDKRSAIIYENININRATNVFIIEKQDYEESMNLIFNYFTDEDLSRKRMSIRTSQNPPEKFKAIEIKTINHDNLNIWINKLNELIVPVSQERTDKSPEHIQFVSGLNIKSGNTERVNTKETIVVKNIHDEIKEKLYLQLSKKCGADNVGTEVSIGHKKIDLVVKNKDSYDLYEVKTSQEVRNCIREAMGQIIDYAFFECKDKVGKMTIVGPSKISQEASEYLQNIRIKHNLPIYYESVN